MEKADSNYKQFIFPDEKILKIDKQDFGYNFQLYLKDKEILYNGILKTNEELPIEVILKELFGYFNISEKEIRALKPCNEKIKASSKRKIEIIET